MEDAYIEKVKQLIRLRDEYPWLEFKVNWYEPNKLGEYISALANGAAYCGEEYGYLVWGVTDKPHKIVGTEFDFNRVYKGSPLETFLATGLKPGVNFSFIERTIEGKRVVLLKIPKAEKYMVSFKKKRFFRIGSSKVDLERFPEKEVAVMDVIAHAFPTVDNRKAEDQDLTFRQLFGYYAGRGIELRTVNFKKNLGLSMPDGEYNLLAQILSDDSRMSIRFSIFRGRTKNDPLFSVREFGNCCILISLDKLIDYADTLNLIRADETNRKVERRDVPLFDPDAFREATINAVLHNKWVNGRGPAFTMYSDRIEILSRGSLPPDQTEEGFFRGDSVPVNKSLARIINQLHISESSGRGVPKITSLCGRDSIKIRKNSILVTIPFNFIYEAGEKVRGKVRGKTQEKVRCKNEEKVRCKSDGIVGGEKDGGSSRITIDAIEGKSGNDLGDIDQTKVRCKVRCKTDKKVRCKNGAKVMGKAGEKVRGKIRGKVRGKLPRDLNAAQIKILDLLRDNPNLTRPQLMIIMGLRDTSIQNNISYLKNNGYIRRIGSDKSGYWEVLDSEGD